MLNFKRPTVVVTLSKQLLTPETEILEANPTIYQQIFPCRIKRIINKLQRTELAYMTTISNFLQWPLAGMNTLNVVFKNTRHLPVCRRWLRPGHRRMDQLFKLWHRDNCIIPADPSCPGEIMKLNSEASLAAGCTLPFASYGTGYTRSLSICRLIYWYVYRCDTLVFLYRVKQ